MPAEQTNVSSADTEKAMLELAIESWRLAMLFAKTITKLDAGEAHRYANQIRYHLKSLAQTLDSIGLRLVTIEGQPYDPGIAASAINIDDFSAEDMLVVDQMLEPIVMGPDGLIKPGIVVLKKVQP